MTRVVDRVARFLLDGWAVMHAALVAALAGIGLAFLRPPPTFEGAIAWYHLAARGSEEAWGTAYVAVAAVAAAGFRARLRLACCAVASVALGVLAYLAALSRPGAVVVVLLYVMAAQAAALVGREAVRRVGGR